AGSPPAAGSFAYARRRFLTSPLRHPARSGLFSHPVRRLLPHRGDDKPAFKTNAHRINDFHFFCILGEESQSVFWILFFALMLANIAHDMVVC
ncbi:hypothetical protein FK513_32400, partial [Klebsiella pneumoniae]|nr:hypothetical protein [Klebsiella pneumoniae]